MSKLRTYLVDMGEKQGDFAKNIDISPAYLSQIMAGDRTPSLDLAVLIEDATDGAVPARWWVDRQDEAQ